MNKAAESNGLTSLFNKFVKIRADKTKNKIETKYSRTKDLPNIIQ